MYLVVNIIGLLVFLAIGFGLSKDRKNINWRSVIVMVVLNLFLAWFLTSFSIGREIIQVAAAGFSSLIDVAKEGISFAFASEYAKDSSTDWFFSVLMPILLVVPLFDILTYIGILPWVIKWIGIILSKITGQPKFESFYSVEMMVLGNTEALAVSSLQLKQMSAKRNLTLAMMSMSCVTAAILASYVQMMPAQYIITAVPLNCINALIVATMLNPLKVDPEEDTIATMKSAVAVESGDVESNGKREPFFSFLGDSILNSGKLILIITANVVAFVALAALIDKLLGLINPQLTLEHILGVIMFPFAWLLGLPVGDAYGMAQYMGTKLITNEFVVMGQVTAKIATTAFSEHYRAVLTVFLTSFANFSTVGMIIGCFKGIVDRKKNEVISANVWYLILSGILVSLLSAGMVGLFSW